MKRELKTTTIHLENEQAKWLKENHINLSSFVREKVRELQKMYEKMRE